VSECMYDSTHTHLNRHKNVVTFFGVVEFPFHDTILLVEELVTSRRPVALSDLL
jgi:hypothetical protein